MFFSNLFIPGIICIFYNWVTYIALNGFSEIIANTHKTFEYVKLQTEMLTEIRTKNLNNNDLPII